MAVLVISQPKARYYKVSICFYWSVYIVLLSVLASSLCKADENPYNLPILYTDIEGNRVDTAKKDFLEQSEDRIKLLNQQLKKHTQQQLTHDSIIYLRRHGIKLETQYLHGDISTEFEANDDGDVKFTLKIPF